MALRPILIPPVVGPDGRILVATVRFWLMGDDDRPLVGQVAPDGAPILGEVRLVTGEEAVEVLISPQTDIAPASNYRITVSADGVRAAYRVQVPPGETALDWHELIGSGEALDEAELATLTLHVADDDRHLPGQPRWDDLRAPATAIPLQGQQGDPDRDTDGSLLFDASAVEQIAVIWQLPHSWAGTGLRPHVHWAKTSDASGNVIWEMRYRVWDNGDVAPAWSEWAAATGRSEILPADQRTMLDSWPEIAMTGLRASCFLSVQIRRNASAANDTYAADARLWEADAHYQVQGFGSIPEYPA
jgi:hypothetical protein